MTTLATLLLQLGMVRTFDVILNPLMGYMVITAAMFALGLGGIYVYLMKAEKEKLLRLLPKLAILYAFSGLLLLPFLNVLPFDMNFSGSVFVQVFSWGAMYLALILPFFTGGIIISSVFSVCSSESHALYFFDLLGAGLGCLFLIPLIPYYGPGGLLFVVAALLLLASFCYSGAPGRRLLWYAPVIAVLVAYPLARDSYLEFRGHGNKRNIDKYISQGLREYVRWDPVSKLDVIGIYPNAKYFALDGGQQASWMSEFDGDFTRYEKERGAHPDTYYYGLSSGAHFLRKDTGAEVLIIGAAVGNETRTALIFGASHVDSIELVGAMVEAAKTRYAGYTGNSFNHPRVNYHLGEGRTFLRSTDRKYDIIQMFSNHTSSSIAEGNGALMAAYLQTAEAYIEYFQHLKDDGILSINRHYYPRMLTTAALAWHRLGREDFARHVVVFERWQPDTLPTMLIKMTPWTAAEIGEISAYLNREKTKNSGYPAAVKPSKKILRDSPERYTITAELDTFAGVSLLLGTHGQKSLDYPVTVTFHHEGEEVGRTAVEGGMIRDNQAVDFVIPPVKGMRDKDIVFEVSSGNEHEEKGFSVWLGQVRNPVARTIPSTPPAEYNLVFDPLNLAENLIPGAFLEHPFPRELAAAAEYRLSPVTDDRPHFNMIRKSVKYLDPAASPYIDFNTLQILNGQLLPFLSSDIINFFVVGVLAVFFALIFIFVPLIGSSLGRARWEARGWYLLYFSCLGAGFIIVELTFIQIFSKFIGFPTHTFATVLFSLLFSAGAGSLMSKRLRLNEGRRWNAIFILLVILGLLFISLYPHIFSVLLQYNLTVRIISALILIFPLGFFMGMPFPLGMFRLGRVEAKGIPWAWGMNGFFTVAGGYLGMVLSFYLGFRMVLFIAMAVYLVAWLSFHRISWHFARADA